MDLIKKIIEKSREVDNRLDNMQESELDSFRIEFQVPPFHPRAQTIREYPYACLRLENLPEKQIKIGLAEIIKHGLAQSPKLYDFLSQSGKTLLSDRKKLKKAIFWACDLKRACLEIDVEENMNGSRSFLRMGHDFSDRIEEEMKLKIPHGFAVAIGIIKQLEFEKDEKTLLKAKKIFREFGIPTTMEEYKDLDAN